jgi:hypothetical protein
VGEHKRNKAAVHRCYLCGEVMTDRGNRDHVPPQQFFPPSLRKVYHPNLITLRTHVACNSEYKDDEEYFVASTLPLVTDTVAGGVLARDMFNRNQRGSMVGLVNHVMRGFSTHVRGIALPPNLIALNVRGERVHRVIWKITRGLYYYSHGAVLPESVPRYIELIEPARDVPKEFNAVLAAESLGEYQAVFAYKNTIYQGLNQAQDVWAMLLWDRIIVLVAFGIDHGRLPDRIPLLKARDPGEPPQTA